ncbi:Hypothetical predicted protein [Podarcis lilfordi]|uniref:Uncharacterized protein n=1 Tax=Podarcis lilfordi TaxID=74358 RepID=A0AA35PQE2_9SAUR|nr:Hypothetical predicted protein [Podarcis lilfordi]
MAPPSGREEQESRLLLTSGSAAAAGGCPCRPGEVSSGVEQPGGAVRRLRGGQTKESPKRPSREAAAGN